MIFDYYRNKLFYVLEKEDNYTRTGSPSQHLETGRTNGHSREHTKNQFESTYSRTYESVRRREHQESVQDDKQRTPSPPARRKPKEQVLNILIWLISNVRIFFLIFYN